MPDMNEDLKKLILDEVRQQLSLAFQGSVEPIRKRLMDLCDRLVKGSSEYESLVNGKLLGELGVPGIDKKIQKIIEIIKNSINVAYQPLVRRGSSYNGGLIINILKADFQDILTISEASYQTGKGTTIQWLDWLLVQGDRIIVLGYDSVLTKSVVEELRSRTGKALMIQGHGWRVPPEFSGTLNDNFLTKAFDFDSIEDAIFEIVAEEIGRYF